MRLIVVSNRLPVTVTEQRGEFRIKESVGGLVSGLQPTLQALEEEGVSPLWIGWPGVATGKDSQDVLRVRLRKEQGCLPVFLSRATVNDFYRGFCNRTLWPLFHYFPTYAEYPERYWRAYRRVNETFADAVAAEAEPDDAIWVHDYHLMLLPQLLRERLPQATIGYFHHIPFPSFELYRLMPRAWGRAILEGLLGADLVGFHTHDYTRYFLRSLLRILGLEPERGTLNRGGRLVRVDTIPLGVDFPRFAEAAEDPGVQEEERNQGRILEGQKVVLSIDRLDYTKGIGHRLEGYEAFLEENPDWHGRVALVLVVVPSRTRVAEYRRMKRQIDQLVGRINGRFGDIPWTPILYQFTQLPFQTLAALYRLADVALVTPLRDGMNLVAMEYVASQTDRRGVLVLSEMAGAARELPEALIVNPSDRGEIGDALRTALEMPEEERVRRIEPMARRLRRRDARWWGHAFLEGLRRVKDDQAELRSKVLTEGQREALRRAHAQAQRRLLLLNYDGTLVPFARYPRHVPPDPALRDLLATLAADGATHVVLVSGRTRDRMEAWFQGLPVGLIAEHGAWVRPVGRPWATTGPLRDDWKEEVLPLFESYADRVPQSAVEVKDFSVVWHYGYAEPELGSSRAAELADELSEALGGREVEVLRGGKAVEVRNAGITKGAGARRWLAGGTYDWICAMGDDWTDEPLFEALPLEAWSLRVGVARTQARWILPGPEDVRVILTELASAGSAKGA